MSFTIKLKQFEGPFDLLLFFIERDELDIYDIPIAKITNDFLDYIHQMESLNLDLASEFILVAATLMRIKAKMLLPRKEIDEEGNEIDPRQELVQRLLEYKKYKSVLEEFESLETRRLQQAARGNIDSELKKFAEKAFIEAEWESVTLFKLMKAFERMLSQFEERKQVHRVYNFVYTILDQQEYIQELITNKSKVDFSEAFGQCENRIHAIITFLAMLELLNQQKISVTLGDGNNNFWISAYQEPAGDVLAESDSPQELSSRQRKRNRKSKNSESIYETNIQEDDLTDLDSNASIVEQYLNEPLVTDDGSGKFADEVIPESYTDEILRQKFGNDVDPDGFKSSEIESMNSILSSDRADPGNHIELDQPLIIDDGSGKYADEVIPESYTDDILRQKFEEDIETDAIKSSEMASNDLSSENSDHENQVELDQPLIIDDGSGKFADEVIPESYTDDIFSQDYKNDLSTGEGPNSTLSGT